MSGGDDDEFDQFLARKRPLFRRPSADEVEPPHDVDRLVLRQARDAIKPSQAERLYRGPGWGVPLAVAATLLVCLSMVLHVVMPKEAPETGAATLQVAHEMDAAPAAAAAPEASADRFGEVTNNSAPPPVAARSVPASAPAADAARAGAPDRATVASPAAAPRAAGAPAAAWRADSKSWLAQIERLRAEGKTAEADAELALYKRQHRAYAASPDR